MNPTADSAQEEAPEPVQVRGLSWAQVPLWVVEHPDLDAHAVRVYAALWRWLSADGRDCWPKAGSIAARLSVSDDTVRRALARLAAAGAVEVVPRYRDDGGQTSNRYVVHLDPPGPGAAPVPPASGTPHRRPAAAPTAGERHQEPEPGEPETREPDVGPPAVIQPTPLDLFEDVFWRAYPRKVDKRRARKEWNAALKRATEQEILTGLRPWVAWWEERNEPEYVPHPATWLHNDRWEAAPAGARRSLGDDLRRLQEDA